MFYNEYEVEEICGQLSRSNNKALVAHALILAEWMNVVNSHSDGWAHCKAGSNSANKLVDILARASGLGRREYREAYWRGDRWEPTTAELAKALAPMKACSTRQSWPSPLAPLERLAAREAAERERQAREDALVGMYVSGSLPSAPVIAPPPIVKHGQLSLFELAA